MAWFRCDDQLSDHPKVMHLDDKLLPAMGLWLMCGVYCSRHLTDGFVPRKVVRFYDGDRMAKLLEEAGLFEPVKGGWHMHDYLHWNPSRDDVLATRAKRQAAGRAGGQASATANAQANRQAKSNPVPVPGPNPVSTVLQSVLGNGSAGEEYIDPWELYQARARRPSLSRKERDWIEDMLLRTSRQEVVAALRAVSPGTDYLKRVDAHLTGAAA